jgi:hypothetical protein
MQARLFTALLLTLPFVSCKDHEKVTASEGERPHVAFQKNIYPADSFWLNIKKTYDSLLVLAPIENGVDSFEFRFWGDPQLYYGNNVFIVKYENDKWSYRKYFFIGDMEDTASKKFFSKQLKTKIEGNFLALNHEFVMRTGQEDILSLVSKFRLDRFPTQASLKDYHGCCLDGVVYFYEVATKNSYKFCVYENPACCEEKEEMNRVFINFYNSFMSALDKEEICWPLCSIKTSQ